MFLRSARGDTLTITTDEGQEDGECKVQVSDEAPAVYWPAKNAVYPLEKKKLISIPLSIFNQPASS
jgi:hypothetical protein